MTFRLYATLQFDRPVEEKDLISPGGYEMEFGPGKIIHYDFLDTEISIDREDRTIVHYMQKNPDYGTFPDLFKLTDLNVSRILDFYVDTDTQDGSEPLVPKDILSVCLEDVNGGISKVPEYLYKGFWNRKEYLIPIVYEMRGHMSVSADSIDDAIRYAETHLNEVSFDCNMETISLEVDREGLFYENEKCFFL